MGESCPENSRILLSEKQTTCICKNGYFCNGNSCRTGLYQSKVFQGFPAACLNCFCDTKNSSSSRDFVPIEAVSKATPQPEFVNVDDDYVQGAKLSQLKERWNLLACNNECYHTTMLWAALVCPDSEKTTHNQETLHHWMLRLLLSLISRESLHFLWVIKWYQCFIKWPHCVQAVLTHSEKWSLDNFYLLNRLEERDA